MGVPQQEFVQASCLMEEYVPCDVVRRAMPRNLATAT